MDVPLHEVPAPVTVVNPLLKPLAMKVLPVVLTLAPLSTVMVPAPPIPTVSSEVLSDPPFRTFNAPGLDVPTLIAEETLAPSAIVSVPFPPPPMVMVPVVVQEEPVPVAVTVPVVPEAPPRVAELLLTAPPLEIVMFPVP